MDCRVKPGTVRPRRARFQQGSRAGRGDGPRRGTDLATTLNCNKTVIESSRAIGGAGIDSGLRADNVWRLFSRGSPWLNPRKNSMHRYLTRTRRFRDWYGRSACTATAAPSRCRSTRRSNSPMTAGCGCTSTWPTPARGAGSRHPTSRNWRASCCCRTTISSSSTPSIIASTACFPIWSATSTPRPRRPASCALR